MEIKGNEKELRELFKTNNNKKLKLFPKLKKKTSSTLLNALLISLIVCLPILLFILSLELNNDLVSKAECSNMISEEVSYALALQETNSILAFIYVFKTPITWLLIAIGLGWIFHGVGFRFIGNN